MCPLSKLNEQQRRAVLEGDGRALVLAGAGSGKTRVIIERIAYLAAEKGVNPRQILALTFTNKAAREMRERVARRLDRDAAGLWAGTFHAFAVRVLRRYANRLDRTCRFTIVDAGDQQALMRRLARDIPLGPGLSSPKAALGWISRLKQDLAAPRGTDPPEKKGIWRAYQESLARADALDFDDLLVYLVRLLEGDAEVRERYQRRYKHILVDEYQDTNRAQYRIARALSAEHGNLFVVGDEDQSIYSWRGADLDNILNFERDYPEASVFRLEQNYRSTNSILRVANSVISRNKRRLGKTLWTERSGGAKVRLYCAEDSRDEAAFVAGELTGCRGKLRDIAVLYRTNAQSRLIEEALRREKVPYIVVGGVQFYARKEVKDLLAYLRLLANPLDDVSLRRIVNVPPRGIGASTFEQVEAYAAERDMPLFEVLRDIEHDQTLPARARNALTEFAHLADELSHERGGGVRALAEGVLARTGYREYVKRANPDDYRDRLEIVDEFLSACADFDARHKGNDDALSAFLEETALVSDVDRWDESTPAVTLLTCHSAKGLEFEEVYLIGLEEGLLPHATAAHSEAEMEEERRLCYVAMTRARKRLTLTYAQVRTAYGRKETAVASRFLSEMPSDCVDVVGGQETATETAAEPAPGAKRPVPAKTEPAALRRGVRVRHARFGPGTVTSVTGSGAKTRARIRFQTGLSRMFLVSVAPLEIMDKGDHG